jgi:mannose-6-phosphate isomerase-like protein (cupin superfamily)
MSKAFSLDSIYVNLRPDDSTTVLKAGPRFWSAIDKRTDLDDGRLMGKTRQRKDWDHWERHPAGDEILVLLSGELELVLLTARGERHTRLKAGQAFVVPKGSWHRGIVHKPGELMFITPGAGTEHRPVTL